MSSSSSTIRISDVVCGDPFLLIHCPVFSCELLSKRKRENHFRTLVFAPHILQGDFPAMVFGNLAHDGEAEARALRARGDLGLGQPVAVFRRQAYAIVRGAEDDLVIHWFDGDDDASRRVVAGSDA